MKRQFLSNAKWQCIETAAVLLAPIEREVVLGDLAETSSGTWRGLSDVLGLVARRQLARWKGWQPWAASLGLTLPASLFLMGWSVATSDAMASLLVEPLRARLLWLSLSKLLLVISWAWIAGFVVGALARGTTWACLLAGSAPCLYCLSKWPGHGVSGLQLLVFVLPALWGVWRGRRDLPLRMGWAVVLAAIAALAPLCGQGSWMHGWWMLWPGWYVVATARHKLQ